MRYILKKTCLALICLAMAPVALAFGGIYKVTVKVHELTGEQSIKLDYIVHKMEGFDSRMADLVDKIEREWLNV